MLKSFWELLRDSAQAWVQDRASSMGAALAYYAIFSLSPLLVLVVVVVGFIYGEQAAQEQLIVRLDNLVGHQVAVTVQRLIEQTYTNHGGSILALLIGFGTLLIAATTVFSELKSSLDQIMGTEPEPASSGNVEDSVKAAAMLRLKSFMIIILIGVMLIASIIASTVVSTLSSIFEDQLLGWSYVVGILNLLLSMVLLTLLFAAIYKTLPQRQLIWKDVMIGAAITALLFIIGKNVTVMYITRSAVGSTFGAAGSLVVLLVWIYYSAQIFLLGAEFTKIYAERYGSTCRKNTQDDHSIERGWA